MEKDNKAKDARDAKPSREQRDRDKKKPGQPVQQQSIVRKRPPASRDFRGVIRLAGKDLDGHLYISEALRRVKGIGHTLASALTTAIQKELSIKQTVLVGDLAEEQLNQIEEIIKKPSSHGVPAFLLNRRHDFETGEDRHLLATDLVFQTKQDVQREKDTRSWIGWRHSIGQRVRGQHTRTTGRTGMTMGVLRKSLAPAQAAAAAGKEAPTENKK